MLRSGFYTLLEKGSGLIFALGTAMLLLRGLSKEDFAAWGLFLVITYFLEMGRSGLLQNGMMTFIAREPDHSENIIGTALVLSVCFSLVSNVLIWLFTGWLAAAYQSPQLYAILPVYYVTNFVMVVLYQCNFVQQAHTEFRGIFWGTFCQRGVLFGWVFFCRIAERPLSLFELALAMLAGSALGAVASWLFARKYLPNTYRVDFQWITKYFHYGKFVLGTNLSAMFYKNIDKLALGHIVGPAAFAVYDAAGKITQMVEAPSFSIAAAVFPHSAREMVRNGPEGIRNLYEKSVGAILAIILPFLLLAVVFAPQIVRVFAGGGYGESVGVLRLTAFFGLFMPFAVQFGTIFDSTGKPGLNFGYTLFTAVINLLLSYFLVHTFGLYGAAYATLIGYSISFVLMQMALSRHFGIRWWRAFLFIPEAYRIAFRALKNRFG